MKEKKVVCSHCGGEVEPEDQGGWHDYLNNEDEPEEEKHPVVNGCVDCMEDLNSISY